MRFPIISPVNSKFPHHFLVVLWLCFFFCSHYLRPDCKCGAAFEFNLKRIHIWYAIASDQTQPTQLKHCYFLTHASNARCMLFRPKNCYCNNSIGLKLFEPFVSLPESNHGAGVGWGVNGQGNWFVLIIPSFCSSTFLAHRHCHKERRRKPPT